VISASSKQTELQHDPTDNSSTVKDRIKAEGLKPAQLSAREITSWAILYLEDNRATLLPDAIAQAQRMILSGVLGKRAAKAFKEQLKFEHSQDKRNVANGQL
jgi:hypothetical protein